MFISWDRHSTFRSLNMRRRNIEVISKYWLYIDESYRKFLCTSECKVSFRHFKLERIKFSLKYFGYHRTSWWRIYRAYSDAIYKVDSNYNRRRRFFSSREQVNTKNVNYKLSNDYIGCCIEKKSQVQIVPLIVDLDKVY